MYTSMYSINPFHYKGVSMAKNAVNKVIDSLRTYFLAGLLVITPLALSVIIVIFLFNKLDGILAPLLTKYLGGHYVAGLGLFILLAAIWLTGLFTKNILGRQIVRIYESLITGIPLLKDIFKAIKQISDTLFSGNNKSFSKAVLVDLKGVGVLALGFLTSEEESKIFSGASAEKVLHVFIPTTPNPTSGFIVLVPIKQVKILDTPVEECFKSVISLGMVHPDIYITGKFPKTPLKTRKK